MRMSRHLLTVVFSTFVIVTSAVAMRQPPQPPPISDGLDGSTANVADGCGLPSFAGDNATAVYFVVLDAGSTGTRAVAHRFRRDSRAAVSRLGWDHLGFTRHLRKPGLSAFRHFPWQCRAQLESLLDSVRMLEGSEEAKYTWLSVNYILGSFSTGAGQQRRTKPVLEMGGGSLQIAYESPDGDQALTALSDAPDPYPSSSPSPASGNLAEHSSARLRLRTRSYLGLGIRESILRFVGHDREQEVANDSPDEDGNSRLSYSTACLAENLTLDFTFGSVSVLLNGTRAATPPVVDCLTRARDLIVRLGVRTETALNHPDNQPVYAIAGVFHLLQFAYKRLGDSGRVRPSRDACPGRETCRAFAATVGLVAEAAVDACRHLPTDGPYKPYYCINLAVTSAFLLSEGGMGLRPETPLVALGGQDALGWTLGFALDHLRSAEAAAAQADSAAAAASGSLSILGVVTMTTVLISAVLAA